jgi:hypothetical protein
VLAWGTVGLVVVLVGTFGCEDWIAEKLGLLRKTGPHQRSCAHNLKAIYTAALDYAPASDYFPVASGEGPLAHESLNVIVRSPAGADLRPEDFVCAEAGAIPADADDSGNFVLTAENTSYAWIAKPVKKTGRPVPLACDKQFHSYQDGRKQGYVGYIWVVYSDGSVKKLDIKRDRGGDYLPPGLTR